MTPYIGAVAQTPVQVGPTATTVTVTGLTNGASYTFRVRSTNAIGSSIPSSPSAAVEPQSTLFDFPIPPNIDSGDTLPVELGMKFKADYNGTITGIRFYKATANTGTHIGSLWTTDGTRLATATFTNETASGWQTVKFASPVAVTAGTTYIASYFTPTGHNSYTGNGFAAAIDHGPLHSIANSVSANGVYATLEHQHVPVEHVQRDQLLGRRAVRAQTPGQPTGVTASAAGTTSALVSWTAPASGGPVTGTA